LRILVIASSPCDCANTETVCVSSEQTIGHASHSKQREAWSTLSGPRYERSVRAWHIPTIHSHHNKQILLILDGNINQDSVKHGKHSARVWTHVEPQLHGQVNDTHVGGKQCVVYRSVIQALKSRRARSQEYIPLSNKVPPPK
jgi:hypothetical protein